MAKTPGVIDADFQLIEHRWRFPLKRTFFCTTYVGLCAVVAYQGHSASMSAAMVCLAGLVWPVVGVLCTIAEKVSPEQESLLRGRMLRDASRHPRQRQLSHQSR